MCGRRFVSLMEDSGFKAVMADKDNKRVLIGMLNHLLPEYARVKDITRYRDREQTPDFMGAKKTVLDLCCEGDDGSLFDVEVQQADSPYMFERMAFYAAGEYHSQLIKRESYDRLNPCYNIVFLGGKLWHEQVETSLKQPVTERDNAGRSGMTGMDLLPEKVVTRYMFREEESGIFAPSSIFCIFAQLGRFTRSIEECSSELDCMLYWFKHGWENDSVPEMFAGIPFLDELGEATRVANFSKEKYYEYQQDMKNERDILFFTKEREQAALLKGLKEGREEGREEGRVEGREEGHVSGLEEGLLKGREEGASEARKAIASSLKASGMDIAQIAQITGLDIATIDSM